MMLMSESVLPVFSSRGLMVSCCIFKSFIHFEFILVHGVRVCPSFMDLHAAVQVSQQFLLNRQYFSHFMFLSPLSKIDHCCLCLFLGSVPLVCISVLIPVPHCLDDCGFVMLPEVWQSDTSCLVFVPQNCFGNSGSFVVPYKVLECLF